ncbi:MAG TPA: hypothetical protein VI072_14985 [Polyangiaceae bacterium]
MLRIYPVALDWLKAVRPLIAQIARYDGDLAKQLRRSSSSVILNLGEGMYSRGGHGLPCAIGLASSAAAFAAEQEMCGVLA